jgi:hypothetical protein
MTKLINEAYAAIETAPLRYYIGTTPLADGDAFLENVWDNKRFSLVAPYEKVQPSQRRLGANRSLPRQRR